MKKNSLKKTAVLTLAICVAFFCDAKKITKKSAETDATIVDERVPIKSKRQLEYPALPQGKKNCARVAEEIRDLYWEKKGLLNNPNMMKVSFMLYASDKYKNAEQFMDFLYELLDKDDNVFICPTLLTPRGHGVAVDSIFKEEKRYLMVVCSWGEKFVIEIPRPVRWIIKEGIVNRIIGCRVVGGDPKGGRYLYDEATGAERGPNHVTIQISHVETILSKEVAQKTSDLFIRCVELETPLPEDQLPPICKAFLRVDPIAHIPGFGFLVDKYKSDPGFKKKVELYKIKMWDLRQTKESSFPQKTSSTDGKVTKPLSQKKKLNQNPQAQQSSVIITTGTGFEKFAKKFPTPLTKIEEVYISGGKEIKNQHSMKSKTLY